MFIFTGVGEGKERDLQASYIAIIRQVGCIDRKRFGSLFVQPWDRRGWRRRFGWVRRTTFSFLSVHSFQKKTRRSDGRADGEFGIGLDWIGKGRKGKGNEMRAKEKREGKKHFIFPFLGIAFGVLSSIIIYQMDISEIFVEERDGVSFCCGVGWAGHFFRGLVERRMDI